LGVEHGILHCSGVYIEQKPNATGKASLRNWEGKSGFAHLVGGGDDAAERGLYYITPAD
jgi:hypothetical protein